MPHSVDGSNVNPQKVARTSDESHPVHNTGMTNQPIVK